MGWLAMSLRSLRQARPTATAVALLVLVTTFVFALAPALMARVADDALRGEFSAAPERERNIQLTQERRISADAGGAFAGVEELGRRHEAAMPPTIQALIEDRSFLVDTPRWSVVSATTAAANMTLRWQPDALSRVRFVTGRPPTGGLESTTWPATDGEPEWPALAAEGALSTTAADRLGLAAGDTLLLVLDRTDRLAEGHRVRRLAMQLTGTFEVIEPTATFWLDDRRLEQPPIRALSIDIQFVDAFALVPEAAYPPFMGLTEDDQLPMRYSWRQYVDPDRLTAATADQLVLDLRRLEGVFRSEAAVTGGQGPLVLQSGLLRLVGDQRVRWHSVEVILAVVLMGPAVAAAAAMAMAGVLSARRRRASLDTWRSRGASTSQLVASLALSGLVLAVPAAVLASILVAVLVPEGSARVTALIAVLVAVVTVVLLVAAATPSRQGPPGTDRRGTGVSRTASGRRLVFESLVVGLALVGAYLLRERGVAGSSSTGELAGADPLIAAVPALVGVAAGIVAVRLAPLPLALLSMVAASRRGLVPALGLRRASRDAATGAVLLVLLATATLAAFSTATLLQIARSAEAVAWQEVGAPFRVTSTSPLPDIALDDLPGATALARGREELGQVPSRRSAANVLLLDGAGYQAIVSGTPADAQLPGAFLEPADGVVPAIVSSSLLDGQPPLVIGDRIRFLVGSTRAEAVIVEVRDSFTALPGRERFLVVSQQALAAADPPVDLPPTTLFVGAPDVAATDLRAALEAVAPGATLVSRDERTRAVLGSPAVGALVSGAAAAVIVTAVYAALAVASALVVAGTARAIETAQLRALGLSRGGAVGLLVVELGPVVAVALVFGGLLGVGLFALLQPGLGLGAIIGSPSDLPLVIELAPLAAVLFAVLAIVAAGLGLAAYVQSRAVPALAIRGGTES